MSYNKRAIYLLEFGFIGSGICAIFKPIFLIRIGKVEHLEIVEF